MRNFKFFGGLIIVIISILALVYFLNRQVFNTIYHNQAALAEGSEWVEKTYSLAGLIEYIEAHPQQVSITSLNLSYPDQTISFQEEESRTLGAAGHIIILGAWVEAQSNGFHPADSLIALEDIEYFALPNVASSSHQAGMGKLRRNSRENEEKVELEYVVRTMIENNHLASADFMMNLLGDNRLNDFTNNYFNGDVEAPLPWSGFYILAQPMLHGMQADEKLEELAGLPDDELRRRVLEAFQRFLDDEEYHSQVNQSFGGDGHNLSFTEQRELYNLFPKGQSRGLAEFAAEVLNGEFISQPASDLMYDILSWPMQLSSTERHMERYGAVYEDRMSILGGVDMGESGYTGERYAQAVLFDDMPIGLWMHMSSNFMNQDYQQRLIYDPELHRRSFSTFQPE